METMHTGIDLHLPEKTEVEANVRTNPSGDKYVVLTLRGRGGNINLYFWETTDVLDKLANECERVTREFIGDVPPLEPLAPSQGYLDEIGEMQTAEVSR